MILLHVWRNAPGRYFCISTKSRAGKWDDHFFKRNQFKAIPGFLEDNRDKDLYWCPHGFEKPRRLKRFAAIPKLLWADLDESDPRNFGDLMPTVAWESSPGRFAAVWVLDRFMTEDLNRRLTYHLKADPGGWDLTQVLRIPGTLNHKYVSKPKVRLMWIDGPTHAYDDIVKALPKERKTHETDIATNIYKKYEKTFSSYVRRQLLRGKPQPGKRSEVLWRLVHELIEAGCTRDEAFELLRVSPWNKFAKRRDGDEQLKRELDKSLSQHLLVENDEEPGQERLLEDGDMEDDDEEEHVFLGRSMADVEEENLNWIWYPYLAKGEVTILEGDPGLGKSYLAQMISKGIVDGDVLPSVKRCAAVSGKVAYFDIENSSGTVTKKRLATNGCKAFHNFYQEEEPFSIDDDDTLERVYAAIEKLRPTLVVFDTLNTYIGSADTHKAAETQQAFKRFIDIARRFNCSVMVLRHLTKSSKGDKALYRGQGSIAFTGLARVVMTVGTSPEDANVRVMAVTKINVTRPPRALTFTIEALPDTLKDQDRSRFVWGEFVDLSSDDIIANHKRDVSAEASADKHVTDWLTLLLREGPVKYASILRAAEVRSIGAKQLFKAAESMGVIKNITGKDTTWALKT